MNTQPSAPHMTRALMKSRGWTHQQAAEAVERLLAMRDHKQVQTADRLPVAPRT